MEDNHFGGSAKNIKIGDFVVSCSKRCLNMQAEIPFSGMAFYHPGEAPSDFRFIMDQIEPDNSGKLLFGSDDFMIPTFLYRRDAGHYDWITKQQNGTPGLSFRISPDWTKFTLYDDQTNTKGERAFHEFGSLFSYAILNRHACVLHGVVMEYERMGILVTAPAGTGKTTHTRMWRDQKRALILNGDRCLCRKTDGVWYAYGMPWAGSSGEYINRRVPISCIVSLKRGSANSVQPISTFQGSVYLMQRIFAPVWPGELQRKGLDLCQELAAEFPVLELSCKPDLDSVEILEQAVRRYGR